MLVFRKEPACCRMAFCGALPSAGAHPVEPPELPAPSSRRGHQGRRGLQRSGVGPPCSSEPPNSRCSQHSGYSCCFLLSSWLLHSVLQTPAGLGNRGLQLLSPAFDNLTCVLRDGRSEFLQVCSSWARVTGARMARVGGPGCQEPQ